MGCVEHGGLATSKDDQPEEASNDSFAVEKLGMSLPDPERYVTAPGG